METDINSYLYREILHGNQYKNLIPVSHCKKTDAGIGHTDHSITKMKAVIEQYSHQMEQVAEKLQESSLEKTTQNIFKFLYNHFQYHADEEDQLLRSPACSWSDRYNGIDCKSYSILAASLLIEMGISCFIRKIKQPGFAPTEFTHVYVIVPKDQRTYNLNLGYYVIDGTVKDNLEPPFIETKDEFMEGLQHYALNAPAQPLNGLDPKDILGKGIDLAAGAIPGGTWVTKGFEVLSKIDFKQISINNIKKIFSHIDCIGGSGFNADKLDYSMSKIYAYYEDAFKAINISIMELNAEHLETTIAEFYGTSKVFARAMEVKKSEGWNSCSTERFDANLKVLYFFRDTVGAALTAYINTYFVKGAVKGNIQFSSDGLESQRGFIFMSTGVYVTETIQALTIKPGITAIPAFEVTEYLSKKLDNPSSFNPLDYIKELGNIIISTQSNKNLNMGINPATGQPYNAVPTEAGMGMVGWLLIGGGILYGINKFSKKE